MKERPAAALPASSTWVPACNDEGMARRAGRFDPGAARTTSLVAFAAAAALLSSSAVRASSALDPTFGSGGLVVSTLSPGADVVHAVAIQPDARIVVGGAAFDGSELMLARYTVDGLLDPTFGSGGVVRGGAGGETAIDLALEPDGGIVASVAYGSGVILTRYLADGTLDDGFFHPYGHGRTYLTLTAGTEGEGGLLRQAENGWFVVGGAYANEPGFALQRVADTGWPDSGFGAFFGFCTAAIGTDGDAVLFDVAELPDGKFIAVGSAASGGHTDFALVRFDENGCPDPSFGSNGGLLTAILPGADERARSVVVQPDGRIVVLGDTGGSPSAFAVVRYRPDGSLDPTFGDAGIALVPVGTTDVARDLVRSADGSFVLGGQADGLFTLVRLDASGHVDPSFGTNGVAQIVQPPFDACCSELHALALDPAGRIVAAGSTTGSPSGTGPDVALARLVADRCGNGIVDPGEACDAGAAGAGCCSPRCELDPPGTPCPDDGLRCTRDVCDARGACVHPVEASVACRASTVPGGARIAIVDDADDRRDRLTWRWSKGAAIASDELGDPTTATGYVLCGSVGSTLAFELDAPSGGTCAGAAPWKRRGAGFRYRCAPASDTGTTRLSLMPGPAGTPRATVEGRGPALSLPELPLAPPLRVELRGDAGLCIESEFAFPARNDARRFKARSDG